MCQIFTVLAHRSIKMKLCDSRKHFIPNLSKPVTAAYSGETENTNSGKNIRSASGFFIAGIPFVKNSGLSFLHFRLR